MDRLTVVEEKLKEAENEIEYMKEEHKLILDGLHIEISSLQRKCSGIFIIFKFEELNYIILIEILVTQ